MAPAKVKAAVPKSPAAAAAVGNENNENGVWVGEGGRDNGAGWRLTAFRWRRLWVGRWNGPWEGEGFRTLRLVLICFSPEEMISQTLF